MTVMHSIRRNGYCSTSTFLLAILLTSTISPVFFSTAAHAFFSCASNTPPPILPGDTIGVVATALTSDTTTPETIEGELPALCRTSAGQFLGQITAYGAPTSFQYTANTVGETVSCTFSGEAPDTDETFDIQYRTGPHLFNLTQQQKGDLALANYFGGPVVALLGILALGPCDGACAAAAVGGVLDIAVVNSLICDPPDPNFMVIATPTPPSLPPLTVRTPFTQSEIDAFNALITNQEQVIGFARAISTSINRAQGASDAGNVFWQTKQTQAAVQYEIQLGLLYQSQVLLLSNLQNALKNGGFTPITVTSSDALNFEHNINSNGLPAAWVYTLTLLGATSADIANIRDTLTTQDPNLVAGTFPDILTNPPFITALQNAAQALVVFSGIPGKANCHDNSVSALALQYGGLSAAASALGFPSVQALQGAIQAYCGN